MIVEMHHGFSQTLIRFIIFYSSFSIVERIKETRW